MLHLGSNIKKIRELSGLNQFDFAKLFGIKDKKGEFSKDRLYTYEASKAGAPALLIERIAKYAGVTVERLKNSELKEEDIKIQSLPINSTEEESYKDKYIKLLEDNNELSSRVNAMEASLNDVLKSQSIIRATVQGYSVEILNHLLKNDQARKDGILSANNRMNSYLETYEKGGTPSDGNR